MNSVLEINAESAIITVSKGFLVICRKEKEDKIPLDDIESIIINSYGTLISNNAIMRLSELHIPIVHCGKNALPCALTLDYGSNVYRKERINLQISASLPLQKNLWKQVVKAKIKNQSAVLSVLNKKNDDIALLADKVLSGDAKNMESYAARLYWGRLFGRNFKRNPDLEGINSFLNYGYAILRASFCRNITAGGLYPELGIHHTNQKNPFCLADDLMEPFRPYLDLLIIALDVNDQNTLNPIYKKALIDILNLELQFMGQRNHLRFIITQIINSFLNSLVLKKPALLYPLIDSDTLQEMKRSLTLE